VKAFVLKYMYVIEENESGMSNQVSDDEQDSPLYFPNIKPW
jgi:hypothetical protein